MQKACEVSRKVGVALALGMPMTAFADAPTGPDYAPILAALAIGTLVVAIVAAGAIKAAPNIAKWGVNKIANFFR